jgi:hypothetical protein
MLGGMTMDSRGGWLSLRRVASAAPPGSSAQLRRRRRDGSLRGRRSRSDRRDPRHRGTDRPVQHAARAGNTLRFLERPHIEDNRAFFYTILPGRLAPLKSPGAARDVGPITTDTPMVKDVPTNRSHAKNGHTELGPDTGPRVNPSAA